MRLIYGLLCDYAQDYGKPVYVGVWDAVYTPASHPPRRPVQVQPHVIVFNLGLSGTEAGKHVATLRLIDEDAEELYAMPDVAFEVSENARPGYEMTSRNYIRLENGVVVPGHGTYVYEILVDKVKVGDITFHVTPPPAGVPAG